MDQKDAHHQQADSLESNPRIEEVKMVTSNDKNVVTHAHNSENSPLSPNSQPQSENALQEQEEIVCSSESNVNLELSGVSPDIIAAITSPPRLPPPSPSPDIISDYDSHNNNPSDVATKTNNTRSNPQVGDVQNNEEEDKKSVEAEVTEQGGGEEDDLSSTDHMGPQQQYIHQDNIRNNVSVGEFTALMNSLHPPLTLPALSNPQPIHQQPQRYVNPLMGNYAIGGGSDWPHYNHVPFQQPIEHNQYSQLPNSLSTLGMSTGLDLGHVQDGQFGRSYSYQHSNNSEQYLNMQAAGMNMGNPMMGHQYGDANSHPLMVPNMTGGNFSLGSNQHQPMFYPGLFSQNNLMTGLGIPNEYVSQLLTDAAYWSQVQHQLSNNNQSRQQLSNQMSPSMTNNSAVFDLNIQYPTHNLATYMTHRPQNISSISSYQLQVNREGLALQPLHAPFGTTGNFSEPIVATRARDISQRHHPVVSRPAILSRSHIPGNELQRLVPASSSFNANQANSSHVDGYNSQAIQQRGTLMVERPGHFQLAGAAQRQFKEVGESSNSSKRSRLEKAIEASNENQEASNDYQDDSSAPDAPEAVMNNHRGNVIPRFNSVYDPAYESKGMPIDPYMRIFLNSNWGKEHKGPAWSG